MNPAPRFAYVQTIRKRGQAYFYFRRGGVRIALPGPLGSPAFIAAYKAALTTPEPPIGADRAGPGTMAALAADWYSSSAFRGLSPASQRTYRRLLEGYLVKAGPRLVVEMRPEHVAASLDAREGTPAQANALRNVLLQLMKFAVRKKLRADNPVRETEKFRYEKHPFPTWSEDHVADFEDRWPLGSRARLALALLIYTGQRRSDVIRMAPGQVRRGTIEVVQQKTGKPLRIPMHAELLEAVAACKGQVVSLEAFLITERGSRSPAGMPFTAGSCGAAGKPACRRICPRMACGRLHAAEWQRLAARRTRSRPLPA